MSQLTLATEAGISTRHLSFLETGRAQPSREMVQLLAGMLDVPLGDRNALLVSAGYAPAYGERPLSAPELEPVRRALQFTLRQQEPFPALVVDGEWNVVMGNEGAGRIFDLFLGPDCDTARNVMRTVFCPMGLRRYIVNWEELAGCLVNSLHRHVAETGNDATVRLRDELLAYPGVPSRWSVPDPTIADAAAREHALHKDDLSLTFFSMITTLGTPRDVPLQQLKIECFFPADAATEQLAPRLASAAPQPIAVDETMHDSSRVIATRDPSRDNGSELKTMTHILAAALVLHLSNFSGAPSPLVHQAQEEVTRVYAGIGVPLEWTDPGAPGADHQPAIRVVLLPYETGDLRRSEKAVMGAAVRTAGGNAVAYVFYRRVLAEADRYEVSKAQVLACSIAHELGHLLLPVRAHAPAGLMRACWSRDEFHRAEQRRLKFLPEEVARIRAGLDSPVEHERGDRARD